jgi:uncharacterized membrane protein
MKTIAFLLIIIYASCIYRIKENSGGWSEFSINNSSIFTDVTFIMLTIFLIAVLITFAAEGIIP